MLDGERIFSDMDAQGMGFISINSFANWICDNCGYHICDDDLPGLETVLDGSNDYRITRDGFIETICVPDDGEEGDNLGASFKASASKNRNSVSFKGDQESFSGVNRFSGSKGRSSSVKKQNSASSQK